jgi:hypothetical protein
LDCVDFTGAFLKKQQQKQLHSEAQNPGCFVSVGLMIRGTSFEAFSVIYITSFNG